MTKIIVYDRETQKIDRTRPYCLSFYRFSNLAGRYNRDSTPYEIDKCKKDTIVFVGDNCVGNASVFLIKIKLEQRKVKNRIVEHNLQLHAHNGSGFDTWIDFNNLPCDKWIVNIVKNGKVNIELKIFHGLVEKNKKQITQYLLFRCDKTHLFYSLKKIKVKRSNYKKIW